MSEAYNDGGVVHGSQKVIIGSASYVCKNIKVDASDADRVTTTDEFGNEARQFFKSKIPTGTATLQLADASTAPPAAFSTLPLTAVGTSTSVNYIIFKVGEAYDSGGETMLDISFAKKMAGGA